MARRSPCHGPIQKTCGNRTLRAARGAAKKNAVHVSRKPALSAVSRQPVVAEAGSSERAQVAMVSSQALLWVPYCIAVLMLESCSYVVRAQQSEYLLVPILMGCLAAIMSMYLLREDCTSRAATRRP